VGLAGDGMGSEANHAGGGVAFDHLIKLLLVGRGLHSLTSQLNLRTFENTSLPLGLNLSTLGTRPRVRLGYMGDNLSLC
jgi:hypothetical protein